MARKRERGNGDGDVWPRKNKQGKIIGYRASYWVDTPSGPKRRYVSGKNKGETRAASARPRRAGKTASSPTPVPRPSGNTWTVGSRTPAAP
jgi:hypothetical protein